MDLTPALSWVVRTLGEVVSFKELTGGWSSTMLALTLSSGDDVVLRVMNREPWRTHGAGLTSRESEIQRMLAPSALLTPRSIALDANATMCGHPSHLMSLLPGRTEGGPFDARSTDLLAATLVDIHDVSPSIPVREYQSWAFESKYVVPAWATDTAIWEDAFAVLHTPPPPYEPTFIHRDFQPRNILWSDGQITGVVDWVETSMGPAWLDVAHCCTNIAMAHGSESADAFADAYVARCGRDPQPYFDVMDAVGFLPPPGRIGFGQHPAGRIRLEQRLGVVLRRLDRR